MASQYSNSLISLRKTTKETIHKLPVHTMKSMLQGIGSMYSLGKKAEYIKRIEKYHQYLNFPWRLDQKLAIKNFLKNHQNFRYFVINGIAGCGKTTMLFGILINAIVLKIFKASEIFFLSFNLCIRNELRQKIRDIGLNKHVKIRTFDSIIYEICEKYEYPNLKLPNFDGKRRFCYDICKKIKSGKLEKTELRNQPKLLLIDETQDLEFQTLLIFKTFFPDTKIIFAGDIFQSIQKEPRETLLWDLLHSDDKLIHKSFFTTTPRVPFKIFESVKNTVMKHYPEFEDQIKDWSSSNQHDAVVNWKRFYNYSDILKNITEFTQTHKKEETMILTFSSAITVRGSMGDVARFRRFLSTNFDINKNHKKMDPTKLFLTTANSSKGLERDHVLVFLTFPLELAFANFSDDIVLNLLTVALTRCKKDVTFFVPAYKDKFSRVLHLYEDCPKPNKEKIRDGKISTEYTFSDYLNMDHCVTEILKQSIVSYDTRVKIKESIKLYETSKIFDVKIPAIVMQTEEERALIGILLENLITSRWLSQWPPTHDYKKLKDHPMYTHCYKRLEKLAKQYNLFKAKHSFNDYNSHFNGMMYYSQLHVAMSDKLFISISDTHKSKLMNYWRQLSQLVPGFKPEGKLSVQENLQMPFVTGIADTVSKTKDDNGYENLKVVEIKASVEFGYADNALSQSMFYSLMTGKASSRLTLLNPFQNERNSYYFNSKKIMSLRKLVTNDIILWNANCFLAKTFNPYNKLKFNFHDILFVYENRNENGEIIQFSSVKLFSPTKLECICDVYFKKEIGSQEKTYNNKLQNESDIEEDPATYIDNFMKEKSDEYTIWSFDRLLEMFPSKSFDIKEVLDYKKGEDKKYELNFEDGFVNLVCHLCYLSNLYKFV
jgi:hypothetical protein